MRACIGGRFSGVISAAHNMHSENLFLAGDFQSALPRHWNPIILAAKAGIDPVGASYPKVICPP
jgi:hypothetical protein